MKARFNLTRVAASVLMAMGLSIPALADTKTDDSLAAQEKGTQLINQVGDVARSLRYNAEYLDSFNIRISERSHGYHLNQIKDLVNDGLNPALAQLQDLQSQLPDWKQRTIDSMLDSAKALAADANSAILERNESGTAPPAPLACGRSTRPGGPPPPTRPARRIRAAQPTSPRTPSSAARSCS